MDHIHETDADRDIDRDRDRNTPDGTPRVAALSDLGDFQVAEGYPDPRGWDVVAADGRTVGKVHDLIVDTGQMRTRYLDLDLDGDALKAGDDRDVLVPVGLATLADDDDRVLLGSLTAAQLATMPEFTHGEITRDYENSVLAHLPGDIRSEPTGSDYYATSHFDDRRFFSSRGITEPDADRNTGRDVERNNDEVHVTRAEEELDIGKRQMQGGEVNVRKHIDTEHVRQPVRLTREEVTIERRPVSADSSRDATIEGDDREIRIPIVEEEAVVNKRAVVKEELIIKKHAVSEDKTVEADVRKERIDVDRKGHSERDSNEAGR
jgi:uncharacterized protein (TIGR02271 family)